MRKLEDSESLTEYFRSAAGTGRESSPESIIAALADLDMQCMGLAAQGKMEFLQKRLYERICFNDYFFDTYRNDAGVMSRLKLKWNDCAPFVFETAQTGLTEMIALGISGQDMSEEEVGSTNLESLMSFLYDVPNPRVFRIYLGGMESPAIKYEFTGAESENALKKGRENILKLLMSGRDNDGYLVADIYKGGTIERYMFRCSENGVRTLSGNVVPLYRNDGDSQIVPCEFYPAQGNAEGDREGR